MGREPHNFNDDAMGRALVKLLESQVAQIYAGLSRQAVERLSLPPTDTIHADTTSLTLYGQSPDDTAGPLPTYGYHKDGHPECKPWVAGVVARTDGIPLAVEVCDGNQDDPTWSRETILYHGGLLPADIRAQTLFVADSKLLSHQTVAELCAGDIRFVSRLPNTFGLERATKAAAQKAPHWETLGPLSAREAERIDRAINGWSRQSFACRADAEAAWERWKATKSVAQSGWTGTGRD